MIGQWVGTITGTNQGLIHADLDERRGRITGHAHMFERIDVPSFRVPLSLSDAEGSQWISAVPAVIDPKSNYVFQDFREATKAFPNCMIPQKLDINLNVSGSLLKASWASDVGTQGEAVLHLSQADQLSQLIPESIASNWDQFRSYVLNLEPQRFVFRGQGQPWRLRTSFHRSSRKDLVRYLNEDYFALQRAVSARSNFPFDLTNDKHNAAFWHLVQHHGYPTPLLDWTYSPYIAAYFAFKSSVGRSQNRSPCRVYVFDSKSWRDDFRQATVINPAGLHASMLEALAYDNARAIPQQSLSMVTNVDDVENYIRIKEVESGKTYLRCFDFDVSESGSAIKELRLMGVTHSSLFPGMDGACEELKDRFFGPYADQA